MTQTTSIPHGTRLAEALSSCRQSALLVAPYIKSAALAQLLSRLPAEVPLTVVTRWRPSEVAAGVSDLEVWNLCRDRPATSVRLADALHAKYYRADSCVFLGSANLTDAGLGWSRTPNIEILYEVVIDETWRRFESSLLKNAMPASEEIRDAVAAAAGSLPDLRATTHLDASCSATSVSCAETHREDWLPESRSPEGLVACYLGRRDQVSSAAFDLGRRDLAALRIAPALEAAAVTLHVRAALIQQPMMATVEEISRDTPRFGELKSRLRTRFPEQFARRDPVEITQTVLRWVTHFFPSRYRIRVYRFTECLERVND